MGSPPSDEGMGGGTAFICSECDGEAATGGCCKLARLVLRALDNFLFRGLAVTRRGLADELNMLRELRNRALLCFIKLIKKK